MALHTSHRLHVWTTPCFRHPRSHSHWLHSVTPPGFSNFFSAIFVFFNIFENTVSLPICWRFKSTKNFQNKKKLRKKISKKFFRLNLSSAPFSKGVKNRGNFQKNLQKTFFSKKIIFWKKFFLERTLNFGQSNGIFKFFWKSYIG